MEDLLKLRSSPLAVAHTQTRALWRAPTEDTWARGQQLFGIRGTYRPTMAAKTIQRLGDVRHALAQRSIAGTLEVHAPFAPELSEEAAKVLQGQAKTR